MLVRTLETLGQAVVDMRGTDAADPRLVLEIALVRLARREAGTPVQALAERVDRLERSRGTTASRAPPRRPTPPARMRPGHGVAASFAELRRRRGPTDPAPPAESPPPAPPVAASADTRADTPAEPADAPAVEAPAGEVDIDDVIVAWAEILPELPPATRAAVREAQPLAVDDGVITFGVPKAHYDDRAPALQKEADNIRAALSQKLGRRMMFKPVAHDGFDADPVAASAPLDEEPPTTTRCSISPRWSTMPRRCRR